MRCLCRIFCKFLSRQVVGSLDRSFYTRPKVVSAMVRSTQPHLGPVAAVLAGLAAVVPSVALPSDVAAAAAGRPVTVDAPTVTGQASEGEILVADKGTWSGSSPIQYDYRWKRCDGLGAACSAIGGATSKSYTIQHADVGNRLRVKVTATNDEGSASAESGPTAPVSDASSMPRQNAPPQADFVFFPAQPVVGEQVDLVSISTDPDGALDQQEWDLDGDGEFDDASGTRAAESF